MTVPVVVPEVGARRAADADHDDVRSLAAQARHDAEPVRGGAIWSTHDALPLPLPLDDLRDEPTSLVAVGTLDDVVLGYLIGVVDTLHDGRRLARVVELYVDPAARELGVGEAILDLALGWATGEGCVGIDAAALPGDRDTKNFFETAGLVARSIVVHRPLGSDGG